MREKEFFHACINLDDEGMEEVRREVSAGNYEAAIREFAGYVRRTLKPEVFFGIPYEEPENVCKYPGETDQDACERMIRDRVMISVGVPCDFKGCKGDYGIDWTANPTYNNYKEWTWQFNRHHELKILAHEYNRSKDPRYAEAAANLFESWYRQAVYPGDVSGYDTDCWRTIECGIRMGANWPYILHTFYNTEAFTDQVLYDWCQSVWEHGNRLYRNRTHGNWLIMEMNGLAHIGILYPQFRQSGLWLESAFLSLAEELNRQIYPDGFQYELSTGYHDVVINNYQRLIETARAYGVEVPRDMTDKLKLACEIDVKLMMPDGRIPDINDGKMSECCRLLEPKRRILPDVPEIEWAVSRGAVGQPPKYLSLALPYSGFFIMRNGWGGDAVWGLLDGAPFGRGHQHEDKLSLLVYAGGKLLITEGGNYAYDDSKMRNYVLSTRAHNTVRVDGQDQNRRSDYKWKDSDIGEKADLHWGLGQLADYAECGYNEGYGADRDLSVTHRRSVFFIKKTPVEMMPFFLVVDRLISETEHTYEFLWHVDSENPLITDAGADTDEINIGISGTRRSVEVISAAEEPEWQGYVATGTEQGMYRPVNCIRAVVRGDSTRVVSVLSPHIIGKNVIRSVEAGSDLTDDNIEIRLTDGSRLQFSEYDMKRINNRRVYL